MYTRDDDALVPEPGWEETRGTLDETVVRLVLGMRSGQFPVVNTDEQCTGNCPYKTVCRINQVRSLQKRWQPTTSSN
ncbi:MAG: hypothetical protein A2V70_09190 [Planctomycetes bacterium RBG_13_63_9]|nr:MAG: hypothetical protein A2V70_09190 [Planctomycetes bacterium RBG_13_63_9]